MSNSDTEDFPRNDVDGDFPRNDSKGGSKTDKTRPEADGGSKQKRSKKKKKFKNKKDKPGSEKKGRLVVRNIPFKTNERELLDLFQQYGLVTEVKLLRKPDGKLVGCGFVNFENAKSAGKAIAHVSGKPFHGRPMIVDWAVPKTVYHNVVDHDFKVGTMKPKNSDVDLPDSAFRPKKSSYDIDNPNRNDPRLFVTNLPFRISEDDLRDYFSQYGPVVDLFIVKQGLKQMGTGFVTFSNKKVAADAMKQLEGKEFQGRPLYFKWAEPKSAARQHSRNEKMKTESIEIKEEVLSDDEPTRSSNKQRKTNSIEADDTLDTSSIKSEAESESEEEDGSEKAPPINGQTIDKEETDSSEDSADNCNDDQSNDDDSDSSDNENDHDQDNTASSLKDKHEKKQKFDEDGPRKSNDISEGLTVFLRNVPFDVSNEELKSFIRSKYGPVYYALVCMDAATEHSRGTAFVKFKNKDSVDAILNAQDDLVLNGELMQASMALSRDEIYSKRTVKSKEGQKNDNRNLYLSKEGLILAGSKAAKDVSLTDMNKRLSIESVRSRLLKKNMLTFVSRTRLVIYNLPPNYTDIQLKKLFQQYSSKKAVITEARVMKDMKKFNQNATFASREFGYVSFTTHEDALEALRNINNNPEIFSKAKRPIVLFSIENKQAIATKEKRLEKSRKNNPLFKNESTKKNKFEKKTKSNSSKNENGESENILPKDNEFQGFQASVGKTVLKSGYKVRKQAQTHAKNVKKVRKLQRQKRQMAQLLENRQMQKGEYNKTRKPKKSQEELEGKDKGDQKFERLVSDHKTADEPVSKKFKKRKIDNETQELPRKKKWYKT
ncbi:unnamed protein product [Bemisia tabaci]|uniref:RRM domain-containing protein n=1 Tax=Bemisia tabaci TaxID=7038 RepID=A0A9P0F4Y6_BEMTA|nr:unnamed protein product [Bemisia tabaci]